MGRHNKFSDGSFAPNRGWLSSPVGEVGDFVDFAVEDYAHTSPTVIEAAKIAVASVWQAAELPPTNVGLHFYDRINARTNEGFIAVYGGYNFSDDIIQIAIQNIAQRFPKAALEMQVFMCTAHEAGHKVQHARGEQFVEYDVIGDAYRSDAQEIEANDMAVRAFETRYPHIGWNIDMGTRLYNIRPGVPMPPMAGMPARQYSS